MTPAELADYQQHPLLGEMALAAAPGLDAVAKVVRQHHERLDGSGFPEGLHAKDISRPARIVAIVADYHDLYHGLLMPQCLGHHDAKHYLQKHVGLAYEERLVKLFLTLVAEENTQKIQRFKATVAQLKVGMLLEQDLTGTNKLLLLTQGTAITQNIIDRLRSYEAKFKCKFELMVKESE